MNNNMERVVIGSAELWHGDCLEVLPSLPRVDAVITDPPYGINTKSDGSGKLSPWADLVNSAHWYAAWFREIKARIATEGGSFWCCLNWRSLVTFQKAACDAGWPIESLMVWDKEWIGPGGTRGLRPSYELVALFAHGDFAITDRSLSDVQRFRVGSYKPNGHPAEKPIALMDFCVKHAGGSVVLDPFMGSGTTGVAAVKAGRRFIGVEMDRQWFDIACKRIEQAQAQGQLFAPDEVKAEQQALL